jgi:methionyl-tRNA formyltransferase
MLEQIILLTAQSAQQLALSELLKAHNPRLRVHTALNAQDLAAIAPDTLRRARLIAFTSGTIVAPEILDGLGYGAYNFHPGPPDYPGWAPAHFALHEGAKTFGATAHLMVERVDAGPIVGIETFPILAGIAVRELEQIAFIRLAYLFWRLAKDLATRSEPLAVLPIAWSGWKSTRKDYVSACQIPTDISKAELELRVRAFHDDFRAIYPTINLHGFQFQLIAPTAAGGHAPQPDPPRPEIRPPRGDRCALDRHDRRPARRRLNGRNAT